jgi:hypothetical protein
MVLGFPLSVVGWFRVPVSGDRDRLGDRTEGSDPETIWVEHSRGALKVSKLINSKSFFFRACKPAKVKEGFVHKSRVFRPKNPSGILRQLAKMPYLYRFYIKRDVYLPLCLYLTFNHQFLTGRVTIHPIPLPTFRNFLPAIAKTPYIGPKQRFATHLTHDLLLLSREPQPSTTTFYFTSNHHVPAMTQVTAFVKITFKENRRRKRSKIHFKMGSQTAPESQKT